MGQRQWTWGGAVAPVTRQMGAGLVCAAAAGLVGSACAWLALGQPALAQAQERALLDAGAERRVQVSIPSQPLLTALRAFGLQTQSQVLFPDDVPAGAQRSAAVHGVYGPREALERMLAPTGVVITAARPGSFALRAAAPAANDAVEPGMRAVALRP